MEGNLSNKGITIGTFKIRCERANKEMNIVKFQLQGKKLTSFGFFNTINSLVKIFKPLLTNKRAMEVKNNNIELNPEDVQNWELVWANDTGYFGSNANFKAVEKKSWDFCYSNWNMLMKVELFNYHYDSKHKFKGRFYFRPTDVTNGTREYTFKDSEKNRSSGKIKFVKWLFFPQYYLIDFFRGGINIEISSFLSFMKKENQTSSSEHNINNIRSNRYIRSLLSFKKVFDRFQKELKVAELLLI